MQLDWLIIGGGIHGVHIAARLLGEGGVAPERLRVLDPAPQLLARWRACTATTGMSFLRSPSVHHLGLESWSLYRFAGKHKNRGSELFTAPYDRPALSLFNAHCDRIINTFRIDELHLRGRAVACSVERDVVLVRDNNHEFRAKKIVLALGVSDQPNWPRWAPRDHEAVHHVFDPRFDGWPGAAPETIAVVGGGISAGQIALRLRDEGHQVHMVSRHAIRERQFDSDPGWLGPKLMTRFNAEQDLSRRRGMIRRARHRGSMPRDVLRVLRRAIANDEIAWHETAVTDAVAEPGWVRLQLATGRTIAVQRVLLATGFKSTRPGGAMLDALIAEASLPCAPCGYPIVDTALRWHPRIHVSGPLAELELGPTARNIAGARRASERITATVTGVVASSHQGIILRRGRPAAPQSAQD